MTDNTKPALEIYPHCTDPNLSPPSEQDAEVKTIRKIIGTYSGKLTPASDTNPICIPIKLDPIKFTKNVNPAQLTDYSRKILEEILLEANIKHVTITSIVRTSHDQARVMFGNLVNKGIEKQRLSYGEVGNLIIDVYEEKIGKKSLEDIKKDHNEIITTMQHKIEEIGVTKVTHHACDPQILNVFDVAPNLMLQDEKRRFETIVRANIRKKKQITKFLTPGQYDPAYHIEIQQLKG
jgi:hypothetical protein